MLSLGEAASLVRDGDTVAIGGALFQQVPMALIREAARRPVRNINLIAIAHGIGADLLIAGGCVRSIEFSFISFELYGLAPRFRSAAERREIRLKEGACYVLLSGLRAGAWGLPFLPLRGLFGTDILKVRSEFKVFDSPIGAEKLVAVPAIKPDIALIHGHRADKYGNVQIEGSTWDDLIAEASDKVVVTVEEIVTTEVIRKSPEKTKLPGFLVDAVVEAPKGAHPTGVPFLYGFDEAHILEYLRLAKTLSGAREYLEKYVTNLRTHEEYLETVGLLVKQ